MAQFSVGANRLADRWSQALALAKAHDAPLLACLQGDRYWPLVPSPFVSSDRLRRVLPLVTRHEVAEHGVLMANCLAASHLQEYDKACRSGGTFLVIVADGASGLPCSTVELRVGRVRTRTPMPVEVVQHTASRNASPSEACVRAVGELLRHLQTEAVQQHLRLGVTAVRALNRQGVRAIASVEQETMHRTIRQVLGEPAFDELHAQCARARP